MITFNSTVGEVEDVIYEKIDDGEFEDVEFPLECDELDEDTGIIASNIRVIVPELNLSARSGEFCNRYEDEEELVPDFSITLIYEKNETNPNKFLYWEQDSIATALYNFLRDKNVDMNDICSCECIVEIDDME